MNAAAGKIACGSIFILPCREKCVLLHPQTARQRFAKKEAFSPYPICETGHFTNMMLWVEERDVLLCGCIRKFTMIHPRGANHITFILHHRESSPHREIGAQMDGSTFLLCINLPIELTAQRLFPTRIKGGNMVKKAIFFGVMTLFSVVAMSQSFNGYMDVKRGDLLYEGKKISDCEMKQFLSIDELSTFESAYRQWKTGKDFVHYGWATTGLSFYILLRGVIVSYFAPILAPIVLPLSLVVGVGALAASQIIISIGYVFRGIGNGRINWVVDNYNIRAHAGHVNSGVADVPLVGMTIRF